MKKCTYCGLSYIGNTCPYCVQTPVTPNSADNLVYIPDTNSSDNSSTTSDSSVDLGGGDFGGGGGGGDF